MSLLFPIFSVIYSRRLSTPSSGGRQSTSLTSNRKKNKKSSAIDSTRPPKMWKNGGWNFSNRFHRLVCSFSADSGWMVRTWCGIIRATFLESGPSFQVGEKKLLCAVAGDYRPNRRFVAYRRVPPFHSTVSVQLIGPPKGHMIDGNIFSKVFRRLVSSWFVDDYQTNTTLSAV